ncbi:hydrogenase 4 membrane subunit [Rhodospirillum rubrum]|uniref:NADH-ubiquinone oxidoreductase, chain 4L n=1 Tax=Rhodospirillum rubrum (strain ATCC 11170 / ATH 1.1.1 / DSM 467 / LMG 4362 / NCIMB 8255 / S1) TaxID=269796 RepID=Q2RXM1_RHORT|nr:hydrogenase 4 membrane subunit [Rhodospirillum rubrum]ABC21124.1 NADH-ubiquinone oxidoreductase, chain 4L [Rhodospirillum rubrum ATCC 11170]AEO46792.1 NADH-ubiquinone oxidoreductase, chain 4L [Rhodospirillum rubrum F11]MBK5952671.1 hydrogenase 4 membrane subunit [Rhodospirillum rubrum]QXG80816.1 hydrogenase 4 membrane subunit [Rhodospirillum rubrum]HAQ00447.1 hydrogenase 4 membrane subunit [Rhodospirillum rubrum]
MASGATIYISLLLIVTSFVVVEWRYLKGAIFTYQCQSVLMALMFVLYGTALDNHALYYWAGTALVSKGVIIPWLLRQYVNKVGAEETRPMMGAALSFILAVVVAALAFWWTFNHHDDLVITAELIGEPYRLNLAVAAVVLVIGFYALLTRRDAFKIVIGLCLLENAVHLSLASLAPTIAETAMIGVVTDVVISVWMMLYVVRSIYGAVGSTDTTNISQLNG